MLAVVTVGKPFFEIRPLWRSSVHRVRRLELIPFSEFLTATPRWGSITNVIFNVALFVPFGLLVALLLAYQPFPVKRTVWIAAGVSLFIEVTQFVFRLGFSDIDDIILNVFGAWCGAMLAAKHKLSKRAALALTFGASVLVLSLIRFA